MRIVTMPAAIIVVGVLCIAGLTSANQKVHNAEYAVRWMPSSGGPATTEEVASALELSLRTDVEYDVRYFDVKSVTGFPEGYGAIARERIHKDGAKTMYKMRGSEEFPQYKEDDRWDGCPLKGKPKDIEAKHQVDISWVVSMSASDGKMPPSAARSEVAVKRVYSISCSIDGSQKSVLPEELSATQVGCVPHVVQLKGDFNVRVERWVLSNGKTLFEVSKTGSDRSEDLEWFRDKVVKPLLSKSIVPMGESKTIVASSC